MPKSLPPYSPEFRRQMVDFVLAGRDPDDLAHEFEPTGQSICAWVALALQFSLRFCGRKRVRDADEIMAAIVAARLVEHLDRSGFVMLQKPPATSAAWPALPPAPEG